MKTIGVIGGMSWESTAIYYRLLNEGVRARLGGLHSARIALWSVDFAEIEALQVAGDWATAGVRLADAAMRLETAGAEVLLLATNTMHRVADAITEAVDLPFVHIADVTASAIRAAGLSRVGLLGTAFTMEQPFYRQRLEAAGLQIDVPDAAGRALVHRVIYDELCLGEVRDASRDAYLSIIERLRAEGAQGIILGCTEVGMLVQPEHCELPLFDTTALHAEAAVALAVGAPSSEAAP